jgi:hypothetical protein
VSSLPTPLRKQLATAIQRARVVAEHGALNALRALAVHEADPYRHMDEGQRQLRRRLRAQARQLGDAESQTQRGTFEIAHLAEKLAYDQWHRLLFARFLLDNNLLISPQHQVSVSLDDCEELALSEGLKDAWAVAARYAAKALPEIFRADDPAGAVDLPLEDRAALVALVTGLPVEVFTASDSLGWCYQFWQADRKDAVNAAGTKIGADELPSVTQLFTEDYMVDFLLDNTLGAWHAGKILSLRPTLAASAKSEDELRQAVALPGCAWEHLRFSQAEDGKWAPSAGTFDGWPTSAARITALDPCMGSGHFIVAMFERLVALRVAEEELDEAAAVAAVIRENLFGLEIDPRCTQICAFNLALAAWRRVGNCKLPAMNLACSGLAPNTREADWLAIAGDSETLKNGMERLYRLFQKAAVLGSLINPRAGEGDLLVAAFHDLQPLLEQAMAKESKDDGTHEVAVTARGLVKAAEILAGQFTLVATNVPYLGSGNQDDVLKEYCARVHPAAKADLATCFIERGLSFCAPGGSSALVTPQNWLFLGTYNKLRRRLLEEFRWDAVARLGTRAFETISGEVVNVALPVWSRTRASEQQQFAALDVSDERTAADKRIALQCETPVRVSQTAQLANPDCLVSFEENGSRTLLLSIAKSYRGHCNGDAPRFERCFWEVTPSPAWSFLQSAPQRTAEYEGRQHVLFWEEGRGQLVAMAEEQKAVLKNVHKRGAEAWGRRGIVVKQMGKLPACIYSGEIFDGSCATVIPRDPKHLLPIWAFCSSSEFYDSVRQLNQKVNVENGFLVKVPFDLAQWQKVAEEKYPYGLPKPSSSDPTQWLFSGLPAGADNPLHVAVARLLGYQWPRQTGSSFPECPELDPDDLEALADADGIVPISPAKGEGPAFERLRELLVRAYGKEWNATRHEELLSEVGFAGSSLDDWLRNGFFEQHCALFQHRPFIWHIWDGRKDGFSALVNCHKLTHANLEKLTFAYLGDWIRRQQAAVDAGEAGSDARLQAAKQLQERLRLILDGEPPFDLFVRWKPLAQQAIGWNPDINDGVRMNIRPFLAQDIPGGKKGAGILRSKPNIKWDKDRGNEPFRDKKDFPWFWGWDGQATDFAGVGSKPDGNRWNACQYTNAFKQRARDAEGKK